MSETEKTETSDGKGFDCPCCFAKACPTTNPDDPQRYDRHLVSLYVMGVAVGISNKPPGESMCLRHAAMFLALVAHIGISATKAQT